MKTWLLSAAFLMLPGYALACSLQQVVFFLRLKRVDEKLQDTPEVKEHLVTLFEPDGRRVGSISFRYYPGNRTLSLDLMNVAEEYRNTGVGSQLFAEAMILYPDTVKVESLLTGDNLRAATGELPSEDALNEPSACMAAVLRTPAMQIRRTHGFSRIETCSRTAGGILLTVIR